MKKLIFSIFLTTLFATSSNAIIGGTPLWGIGSNYVYIRTPDDKGCSGTMITPEWVLTAAHCTLAVKDLNNPKEIFIEMRDLDEYNNTTLDSEVIAPDRILVHPRYGGSEGKNVDIALFHLPRTFTKTSMNYKVPIFTKEASSLVGKKLSCYGFGQDLAGKQGILKVVNGINVTSISSMYGSDQLMVTPNAKKEFFWHGDSGGPCTIENTNNVVIAGIMSSGQIATPPTYGHIVSASAFYDWVFQTVYGGKNKFTDNWKRIGIIGALEYLPSYYKPSTDWDTCPGGAEYTIGAIAEFPEGHFGIISGYQNQTTQVCGIYGCFPMTQKKQFSVKSAAFEGGFSRMIGQAKIGAETTYYNEDNNGFYKVLGSCDHAIQCHGLTCFTQVHGNVNGVVADGYPSRRMRNNQSAEVVYNPCGGECYTYEADFAFDPSQTSFNFATLTDYYSNTETARFNTQGKIAGRACGAQKLKVKTGNGDNVIPNSYFRIKASCDYFNN